MLLTIIHGPFCGQFHVTTIFLTFHCAEGSVHHVVPVTGVSPLSMICSKFYKTMKTDKQHYQEEVGKKMFLAWWHPAIRGPTSCLSLISLHNGVWQAGLFHAYSVQKHLLADTYIHSWDNLLLQLLTWVNIWLCQLEEDIVGCIITISFTLDSCQLISTLILSALVLMYLLSRILGWNCH